MVVRSRDKLKCRLVVGTISVVGLLLLTRNLLRCSEPSQSPQAGPTQEQAQAETRAGEQAQAETRASEAETRAVQQLKEEQAALQQQVRNLQAQVREANRTSALPPIYHEIDESVRQSFDDQCRLFRETVPPQRRLLGIAGLFNTGTNLMAKLLNLNCNFDGRPTNAQGGSRTPFGPVLYQVPFGKHNHPHWQGKYFVLDEVRDRWIKHTEPLKYENMITVVLVKDPLNWMHSMCRSRYVADGEWWRQAKCPSLIGHSAVHVQWDNGRVLGATKFKTILDFWADWQKEYFEVSRFRFFMRYEDVLFDQENALRRVCTCAGGVLGSPLVGVAESAKAGAGLGGSGLQRALALYSSQAVRLENYTKADLEFIQGHAGAAEMMRKLGYFVPDR